jgi:hypothetical protein
MSPRTPPSGVKDGPVWITIDKSAYHHLSMKCHRHVRYELDKSEEEIKNGELR